jgi:hypothetical protein
MQKEILDPELAYTFPESRGKCGFCGKEENGYAKRDEKTGKVKAACWKCVRPAAASAPQAKRKPVGTVFVDTDLDVVAAPEPEKKKAPGLAPSTYRPAVR